MALLVVKCDGASFEDLERLVREFREFEVVVDSLICTDEQERDVRRAIDW